MSSALAAQAPHSLSAEEEEGLLKDAVSEVGNSPVDFIRAVERHLRLHPTSTRREDLERAILRAAIDARDNPRIITYGEKILHRENDLTLMDRVARAFLASGDPPQARRSLPYSERLEKAAREAKAKPTDSDQLDELDRTIARALALQARAWGNLGELQKAVTLALKSYETYPNGEAAREAARWEAKLGRLQQALEHYADAFSIPDPGVTEENRRHHRAVMGELFKKLHGSEAGLGDLILKAYDRTAHAVRARQERQKASHPNAALQDAFEYRLTGLQGDSIRLADFDGKLLVLDFWTTWCVPCRTQHALFEQLKAKYKDHQDVVFLSINADQDRSLVKPFIEELKWSDRVYFEDGLARFYRITSIPTTLIFNRHRELVTRLPGFTPSGFLELITEKINQARNE